MAAWRNWPPRYSGRSVVEQDGRDLVDRTIRSPSSSTQVVRVGAPRPATGRARAACRCARASSAAVRPSAPACAEPLEQPELEARGRRTTSGRSRRGWRPGRRSGRRGPSADCRMARRRASAGDVSCRHGGLQRSAGVPWFWGMMDDRQHAHRTPSRATSTRRSRRSCWPTRTGCYSIALRVPRRPARRRGGRPGRLRPRLPGPRRLPARADPRAPPAAVAGDDRPEPVPQPAPPAHAGRRRAGPARRGRARTRRRDARHEPRGRARRVRADRERLAALLADAPPPAYRVPVVLRHVDDLSYAELAEALGRPEGTVKAQVHRGLARCSRLRRRPAARARGDDRMNHTIPIARRRRARRPRDAPGPGTGVRGDGALVEVGLADRYARRWTRRSARCGSRGTGAACRRWSWRPTRSRPSEPATRPDRPADADRRDPARAGWPTPSRGASPATGGSGSPRPARPHRVRASRSGRRRSRSRAARSGRTAGSPPRSAGRRRSGRSGRRSATTRCR